MAAKRDEQRQILWEQWSQIASQKHANVIAQVHHIFAMLKQAVCNQMIADTARFTHFGNRDEGIYTCVVQLMEIYRNVITLAEEYQGGSPTVKALLMGISELLDARIKALEEIESFSEVNPIAIEKEGILNKGITFVSENIDAQAKSFLVGLREEYLCKWDKDFDAILKDEVHEIFGYYRDGMNFCIIHIDDISERPSLKHYFDLVEKECEELGIIIDSQASALEKAIKESFIDVQQDRNTPLIHGTVDNLRKAYKQTTLIINGFKEILQLSINHPTPHCSFEEFKNYIDKILDANAEQFDGQEFFKALKEESMFLIDEMNTKFMKSAYKLQCELSQKILLGEEIIDVFSKVLQGLPAIEHYENVDGIDREILNGISETLQIKIDSLEESIQHFNQQGMEWVRELAIKKEAFSEEERQEIENEVGVKWEACPPSKENIDEFFERFVGCEVFAPCSDRINKSVEHYTDKAQKSIFRFKKEVLLYEVSTYEEILTHSVSRLRESDNQTVKLAAALLDNTFNDLGIILKKNNIEVIKPIPHQLFDAKEHEVVVAEKEDGFERGEIIKLVTTGYKSNDQVILRANVIAAK
ncbi:MAG: nucleotide exchange factor GrpE [Defluviitaleaceae bacterium]|nr:nucleotide exchange factor GrpE [Defluviitaleaceae bacterium]